jgi:hypothetical protein
MARSTAELTRVRKTNAETPLQLEPAPDEFRYGTFH